MLQFYKTLINAGVYVVVQFGFWFNLDFPLFFSMLMYDNEYQTKENPNWTKNQIELQHIQNMDPSMDNP